MLLSLDPLTGSHATRLVFSVHWHQHKCCNRSLVTSTLVLFYSVSVMTGSIYIFLLPEFKLQIIIYFIVFFIVFGLISVVTVSAESDIGSLLGQHFGMAWMRKQKTYFVIYLRLCSLNHQCLQQKQSAASAYYPTSKWALLQNKQSKYFLHCWPRIKNCIHWPTFTHDQKHFFHRYHGNKSKTLTKKQHQMH